MSVQAFVLRQRAEEMEAILEEEAAERSGGRGNDREDGDAQVEIDPGQ